MIFVKKKIKDFFLKIKKKILIFLSGIDRYCFTHQQQLTLKSELDDLAIPYVLAF